MEIELAEVRALIQCAVDLSSYESHIEYASAANILTELSGVQIPIVRDEWPGNLYLGDIALEIRLANLQSSSLRKLEDFRFYRIDYFEGSEDLSAFASKGFLYLRNTST